MSSQLYTLGIETSCDETSVALLRDSELVAGHTYSQLDHSAYGGVVPELASRAHVGKLDRLCAQVLADSGVRLDQIGLVATTDSPGLAGALLVGVSFACGLSVAHRMPVVGVHHLEGHICAALIEHGPLAQFPLLALVVSGGHTALYLVRDIGTYECIGRTVDDAAGEAFDKVGTLLGFAYPAGRAIDEAARKSGTGHPLSFPVHRSSGDSLDFSFSGLKTAVKYHVGKLSAEQLAHQRPSICAAFQKAVVSSLVSTTLRAADRHGFGSVICSGGVAANGALRAALQESFGKRLLLPSPSLCTDNAAMIARAGYERHVRGLDRVPRMSPSRELSSRMG